MGTDKNANRWDYDWIEGIDLWSWKSFYGRYRGNAKLYELMDRCLLNSPSGKSVQQLIVEKAEMSQKEFWQKIYCNSNQVCKKIHFDFGRKNYMKCFCLNTSKHLCIIFLCTLCIININNSVTFY